MPTAIDIFNTTRGAVTLGSLVRDVISGLWVIRVGGDRDQSLLMCQIKLYMAKLRLMTWAQALISRGGDLAVELEDLQPGLAAALTMLLALIRSAEERSNNTAQQQQRAAPAQRRISVVTNDLETASQRITTQLNQIWQAMRGRAGSIVQAANWVLYDRESLNELVSCITEVVQQLETAYPASAQAAGADLDIAAIVNPNGLTNPEATLRLLGGVANDVYPELGAAAREQQRAGDTVIFREDVRGDGPGSQNFFGVYDDSAPTPGSAPARAEFLRTVTGSGKDSITIAGIVRGKGPFARPTTRSKGRRAASHRA